MIQYKRSINYYESDQMRIVHHSNYIRYFEEARLAWMEHYGMDYALIEEKGLIIPVLSVDCRYQKALRYGDAAVVHTQMQYFDGVRMGYQYQVINEQTGEVSATGSSTHCILNRAMKPILLRKHDPELYQMVCAARDRDGGSNKRIRGDRK